MELSGSMGNRLNQTVMAAKRGLFEQGELAQLTFSALDIAATNIGSLQEEEIKLQFPIGYGADKTTLTGTKTYSKDGLVGRYQFLAHHQLAVNGIFQLVTIIEAMLGDIIRLIVVKYPHKLGGKRNLPLQIALSATSIEEVHLRATESLLNDLSYKSPAEFAEEAKSLLGVNLLECPPFHRYVEMKATRDIYIHNRGVANDVYLRKAGSHARVKAGVHLPVETGYFLASYEDCIQITEWLEGALHAQWHSSELEARQEAALYQTGRVESDYDTAPVDE